MTAPESTPDASTERAKAIAREYAIHLRDELFTPLLICATKPTEAEFLFSITHAILEAAAAIQRGDGQTNGDRIIAEVKASVSKRIVHLENPPPVSPQLAETAHDKECRRLMLDELRWVLERFEVEARWLGHETPPAAKPNETAGATPMTDVVAKQIGRLGGMYKGGEMNAAAFCHAVQLEIDKLGALERELAAVRKSAGAERDAALLFTAVYSGTGTFSILSHDKLVELVIGDEEQTREYCRELNDYLSGIKSALRNRENELAETKAKLAERDAELAECRKECEEQARLNGMGSEREARLMARLAEQSAALDACKGVLLELRPKTMVLRRDRWDGNELVTTGETQRIDAALAQIEALAGGKQTKE